MSAAERETMMELAERCKQAEAELEVAKAFHDVAVKERDRNLFTAQTIGADLASIGRLCGIKDDEYPLKAVQRVVDERNKAIRLLDDARDVLQSQHDPEDNLKMIQSIDELLLSLRKDGETKP